MARQSPGQWLRKQRERCGLSLRVLGDMSGLHFMAIQRMEAGMQAIGLDDAVKLAPHIGVTAEEFASVLLRETQRAQRQVRKAANG